MPIKIGYDKINDIPFHGAIKAALQRGVVLPDDYYGELRELARQLALSITGLAALDQLQTVKDSLAVTLQRGSSQQRQSHSLSGSDVA